jgi:hypothetical protein
LQLKKLGEKNIFFGMGFAMLAFGTRFAAPAILAVGARGLPFWQCLTFTSS